MAFQSGLDLPDIADIQLAQARIRERARQTPVVNSAGLDAALGCRLYCKCENLQRTGAFKFRGASNAIARLREERTEGDIATHSSGNHGAALALAAQLDDRQAHIVMPDNSSPMKIKAVQSYGGVVHFCAPNHDSRAQGLARLVAEGKIPVHPYDHADIIAGQGTAALELEQEVPTIEQLLTPIGGGGLISGTAIATRSWGVHVYGVEPEGAADTYSSLEQGRIIEDYPIDTIADGLRAIVGQRNFQIIGERVKQVLTVSDEEIRRAMALFWQKTRLLIEPSSATVIAAIRLYPEIFRGNTVGVILSGGNISPSDWNGMAGEFL